MLYHGRCHCGRVRFRVEAEIDHVRVCDCSICHMRGALIFRVPEAALELLTPLKDMVLYEWGSCTAKDYLCPTCGILPYRRPSAPTREELDAGVKPFEGWAINTRCLIGFDPSTVPVRQIRGSLIRRD